MAKLEVMSFRGEIPKINTRKLPPEAAEVAVNLRISSGNLEAWNGLSDVTATLQSGVVRSIFLYEGAHWFSGNLALNLIKSPIAQDPYARVYFTGDGVPKVTSNLIATGGDPKPVASYELGVPAPESPVLVSVTPDAGADLEDFSDDDSRFYFMTYVTEYDEEGPQSPESVEINLASPSTDVVDLTLPIPTINTQNITSKRIYRTVNSGAGTSTLRVAELPLAQTAFTDNVLKPSGLLITIDYDTPPPNMTGLVLGSNGIAAGFAGNEFIPSVAFIPYAYPVGYRLSTEHDIVAIVATATGFVAATKGYPYTFTGLAPDALSPQKLDVMQACVSATSMVDMGEFAIYASPDGLVAAGETRAELMTDEKRFNLFSKREWQLLNPETIHAYRSEDRYIAFYGDTAGDGNGIGGFIFDPRSGDFVKLDFYATAGFNDLETDTLYLVVSGQLKAWDSNGVALNYCWRSKIFRGGDVAFSCVKVYTDSYASVGFKLWVDGVLVINLAALPSESFRLPSIRGTEWQFELEGTAQVQKIALANALSEFD